tara:strand:- start:111 stop:317 length:207 start_codon:yes stop_codon:yes gene_type:complete
MKAILSTILTTENYPAIAHSATQTDIAIAGFKDYYYPCILRWTQPNLVVIENEAGLASFILFFVDTHF